MDPAILALLMRQQMGQGGMFGGHSPMPPPQMPTPNAQEQPHHGGLSPLMALSPLGGLMASNPKVGLFGLSPMLGFANLLGAFK